MLIVGLSVSLSRKLCQHRRARRGHKGRSALRPIERHLVSRAADADAQQTSRCGSLHLGVCVAEEVALVLPLFSVFVVGFIGPSSRLEWTGANRRATRLKRLPDTRSDQVFPPLISDACGTKWHKRRKGRMT